MASGVWKAWSGISGLSVCVYVMKGVSVITWPTAHETEKTYTSRVHSVSQPKEQDKGCIFIKYECSEMSVRELQCA